MTVDENNHLFCGHGEQMFTVILCSVKKKKDSSTQHKQPRWPGSIWALALGFYFIYHSSSPTALPRVRLRSPASTSVGEACTEIYYVRASFLDCSWPLPHWDQYPICRPLFFLPLQANSSFILKLLLRPVTMLWGILIVGINSRLAFSVGESHFSSVL